MTLMNEQRKRNLQIIQQVKDLARDGKWLEAKRLVDSLPRTADTIKLKERIEKQLFIATGEVPQVMEGSMALADADDSTADVQASALKQKVSMTPIPSYWIVRAVAYLIYGGGGIVTFIGVISLFIGLSSNSSYQDAQLASGFAIFISGFFTMASGATMLMFVDIARNTFRANNLLIRLLERGSE